MVVTLSDSQGRKRGYLWQVHAGQRTIAEVDPQSVARLPQWQAAVQATEKGRRISLPLADLQDMTPPISVLVQSNHMASAQGAFGGDVQAGLYELPLDAIGDPGP